MEYEKYNLEELQKMFEVEENPEELNKIMSAISDKHDFLSDDNEETNNVQLEEEIYQQMNLIKLRDLNALPLEEIKRKIDKKYGKMIAKNKINEMGEEIDLYELETNLVNNVIPKPEEFGDPSIRNTHFLRPRYVPAGRTSNFSSGLSQGKLQLMKKLALPQLVKLVIS